MSYVPTLHSQFPRGRARTLGTSHAELAANWLKTTSICFKLFLCRIISLSLALVRDGELPLTSTLKILVITPLSAPNLYISILIASLLSYFTRTVNSLPDLLGYFTFAFKDFLPWRTVYRSFARFREDGTWDIATHSFVMHEREWEGRGSSPTAAVIGSHSINVTERVIANAGLMPADDNGAKRNALVDMDDRPMTLHLHGGDVEDRCGQGPVPQKSCATCAFVKVVFADAGDPGPQVANASHVGTEIVHNHRDEVGFAVLPNALSSNGSLPGSAATAVRPKTWKSPSRAATSPSFPHPQFCSRAALQVDHPIRDRH